MTDTPRPLTETELGALRDAMKGAIHPLPAASENTPNALTAETLRKSDAGVDVHQASSVDELFEHLGIQEMAKKGQKNADNQ